MLEIWHFIARHSVQNAGKVWDDLRSAIDLLVTSPGIGHARPEAGDPTLKFWPVHSYLIVYRPRGKTIDVPRVVDGRRDLRKLFRRRKP